MADSGGELVTGLVTGQETYLLYYAEGKKEGRSNFYTDTTEQLPSKLGEYHTPANIPPHPVQAETECLELQSSELLRASVTSADVQLMEDVKQKANIQKLQVSPCRMHSYKSQCNEILYSYVGWHTCPCKF